MRTGYMSEDPGNATDRREIDAALAELRASGALGQTSRLAPLLGCLVAEELTGRGDGLKGTAIGTTVFDRPADFDPNADSIVRVEVNRLRSALAQYDATAGQDAEIRIDVPDGGHRPRITRVGRRACLRHLAQRGSAVALGGAAVDRAPAAAPLSALALNAAMSFEAARPDPDLEAFSDHARRALEQHPDTAFTRANLGADAGRWREAMALHETAMALADHPPKWTAPETGVS